MDYSRYPANWRDISHSIRERDGQRCKYCGAPNGVRVLRNLEASSGRPIPEFFRLLPPQKVARMEKGRLWERAVFGGTRIVLTVAHLGAPLADGTPGDPHNKMDVRDSNLAALCQRCHLMFDLDDHIANAKRQRAHTRRTKAKAAGQKEFL